MRNAVKRSHSKAPKIQDHGFCWLVIGLFPLRPPYLRLRQCGCCICCTSSTAGTEELLRQSGWFWLCRIWSSCWRCSSEVKASKLWSCRWLRCPTSFSFKKASVRCLADWALVSLTWWRLLLWCFRQTKSKTGLAVCRLQGRAVCPFTRKRNTWGYDLKTLQDYTRIRITHRGLPTTVW